VTTFVQDQDGIRSICLWIQNASAKVAGKQQQKENTSPMTAGHNSGIARLA
jgi:hypothetical protein